MFLMMCFVLKFRIQGKEFVETEKPQKLAETG